MAGSRTRFMVIIRARARTSVMISDGIGFG